MNDIDIFTKVISLQYSRIKRLSDQNFHEWKIIPSYLILQISPMLRSRELYQIQISEKYKKPTSQLYYEGYFNNFDFDWESTYLLQHMVTADIKLKIFQYNILKNIISVNKMLFKLRKVDSLLCSFCRAEDETHIHLFYRCKRTSILWRHFF